MPCMKIHDCVVMAFGCAMLCGDAAGAAAPLVRWTTSGGLCPTGPCYSQFTVLDDGHYTYQAYGTKYPDGTLPADELAKLKSAVKSADYTLLREATEKRIPPSAADGADHVVSVYRDSRESKFRQWMIDRFYDLEPIKTFKAIMDKHLPKQR